MTLPFPDVIERARKRNQVPADWRYTMCANGCGELVFYPPDAATEAAKFGVPLVIICSSECARDQVDKHQDERWT